MTPEVGVFQSKADGERAVNRVAMAGVSRDKIRLLTPESTERHVSGVPVSDSEQPGMGAAVGTVVGGALGSAGGFGAGAAFASLLLPGVGPILAGGLLGAGLLGLGGLPEAPPPGRQLRRRSPGCLMTSCLSMKTPYARAAPSWS